MQSKIIFIQVSENSSQESVKTLYSLIREFQTTQKKFPYTMLDILKL